MNFQPVVPYGGVAGWAFLAETRDRQQQAFNGSTVIHRDTDYFREHIADAKTAADLVADRRLLSVALGAFGLDDDINNRFFIEKILDDGVLDDKALANRLSDPRYAAFSKAFGFGDFSIANTQLSDFPDEIVSAFHDRQFEISVGNQNSDLRLAMGVERDLGDIISQETTNDGFWFSVMGNRPLRRVFESALGLPASLAGIDLDQQVKIFREKSERIFGNGEVAQFSDPQKMEKLTRLFLVRSEFGAGALSFSPGANALVLLQNAPTRTFL